ncbi:hypothetical protein PoB_000681600 [Plakobranchus ocellatus]|uniref:Uncharacterized protein n=1 Tax=Plakobranchus ocellatus TaxID=259542 RepID=A0AAV3YAW6_9GAST|nr:hypothetical protein PoB_000681600 [Plakobranchus ocellatus]
MWPNWRLWTWTRIELRPTEVTYPGHWRHRNKVTGTQRSRYDNGRHFWGKKIDVKNLKLADGSSAKFPRMSLSVYQQVLDSVTALGPTEKSRCTGIVN